VDTQTVVRLRRVITRLSRQLNASAAGQGLTPSQASALSLIVARGPLTLNELATLEGLNPTMVSRVVGKLDDARLIIRAPNENDLRSATVEATADGRHVQQVINSQRAKVVSECLARLPRDQQDALADALGALEALADELRDRPSEA
jgi:DNA-binding MarR family transcriptional regulator